MLNTKHWLGFFFLFFIKFSIGQEANNNRIPCENNINILEIYEQENFDEFLRIVEFIDKYCDDQFTRQPISVSKVYGLIGDTYYDRSQFDRSILNYIKAIQYLNPSDSQQDFLDLIHSVSAAYIKVGKPDTALLVINDAIDQVTQDDPDLQIMGRLLYKKGTSFFHLERYDSCKYYFDVVDSLFIISDQNEIVEDVIRLYQGYASYYKATSNYKSALKYDSLVVPKVILHYGSNHFKTADAYNRLGITLESFGKLDQSLSCYNEALQILKLDSLHLDVLANTYENLAYVYYKKGDYGSALSLLKEVYLLREQLLGPDHYQTIGTLSMYGLSHFQLENYVEADSIYDIVINKQNDILPPGHQNVLNMLLRAGLLKHKMGFSAKGVEMIKSAISRSIQRDGPDNSYLTYLYSNLGSIYLEIEEFEDSGHYFYKAIKLYEKHLEPFNPRISIGYRNLITLNIKSKKYHEAVQNLRKSFNNLSYDIEDELSKHPFPLQLLNILDAANNLYYTLYEESKDSSYREMAIMYGERAIALLNIIRLNINDHQSQIEARKSINHTFERMLSLYYSDDSQLNDDGFLRLIQLSKNYDIYNSALQSSVQVKYVSDPLVLQLTQFRKQKSRLLRNLNSNHSSKIIRELASVDDSISLITKEIQNKHPNFSYLKNNLVLPDIKLTQSNISNNEMVINFFQAEDVIFAYAITKQSFSKYKIREVDLISNLVIDFNHSIKGYFLADQPSKQLYDSLAQNFVNSSHRLFNELIAPLNIADTINQLTILPDGILTLLPFEVLIDHKPENNIDFRQLNYLIRSFEINYKYYSDPKTKDKVNIEKSGVFAPSFLTSDPIQTRTGSVKLDQLKFNQEEALSINAKFKGDLFLENQATKEQFIKNAPSYQIIHLATHGVTVSNQPYLSFLAFSGENENTLDVSEIYALEIPSALVVLSACETAGGTILTNEGLISLSRAFSYAGALSVVSTLWSVNDEKTKFLFDSFYKHLKNGAFSSQALRNSKIEFILNATTSFDAHPYYWAPFIFTGKNLTMHTAESNMKWYLLTAILLFGLFFFNFFSTRK